MATRKHKTPVGMSALRQTAQELRANVESGIQKLHALEEQIDRAHKKAHSLHLESEKPPKLKRRGS